jgi:glycosyltransferase involved in cell wall biosynthesis
MPASGNATDLDRERVRQETIAKRIENESKALLWTNVGASVAAGLALILSLAGAFGTALAYLETREKERQDRAATQAKEREDRLAATLSETLTRLVAEEPRERAVGAAGLIYFFAPDRVDFHMQALAALIAAARNKAEDENVRQSLRLAIEQAVRSIDNAQLRKVSWQNVVLQKADLAGCDLRGVDLRDADLRDADLSGTRLGEADLTAAQLQGADLSKADLSGANLTYADLAGGSLAGAELPDTRLDGLMILNLDVAGARFGEAVSGWRDLPWEAARDWRLASFPPTIREELDRRYGEAAPSLHVLMLVWEMPPTFVAGGTWTACYHLVRKLRRRGARVTVAAPWRRSAMADTPFGVDVPIVGFDIDPPSDESPYQAAWNPYGGGEPPYGGGPPGWSPYGSFSASPPGWSAYGTSVGVYGSDASDPAAAGSSLYRLMGEFRRRLASYLASHSFDLIHAHDWVTFEAAQSAAEATGTPWIAHFHSTETERQHGRENPLALAIERSAVRQARRVIAPSRVTAELLVREYGAPREPAVIPNILSERAPATFNMGRFETRRVLFIGRLTPQKGVDLFVNAVGKARQAREFEAEIVGAGDDESLAGKYWLRRRGAVPWEKRGDAFRGASIVLVPSRFEPFGMVILEAMQHRVPVIYPERSGAAEVLRSGIKADPQNSEEVARRIVELLDDLGAWEAKVRAQADEIDAYPDRNYEDRVIAVWKGVDAAWGAAEPPLPREAAP